MNLFPFRWIVGVTLFCAIFGPPLAAQTAPANPIRRIYVEPFATREGSEKFREDLIAELRKKNGSPLLETNRARTQSWVVAARSGSKDIAATIRSWARWHPTAHLSLQASSRLS